MTEDDAFIHTLHDHHDDEMPRLVYADWLDEQGDPRGAYLRAEVDYFRSSKDDDAKLKALQEGLDPIWINMVSRAPYGIIVPGLTFSKTGPRITREDLKQIEDHWQAPLPADYAAFLLVHNGGVPSKNRLESHQDMEMENGDEWETFWYYDELRFFTTVECQGSDIPVILQNLTDLFNNPVIEDDFRLDPNRYKPIGRITFDKSYDGHDESEGLLCYQADPDPNDVIRYFIIEYTYQSRQLALGNHHVYDSLDFIEVLCNLE